ASTAAGAGKLPTALLSVCAAPASASGSLAASAWPIRARRCPTSWRKAVAAWRASASLPPRLATMAAGSRVSGTAALLPPDAPEHVLHARQQHLAVDRLPDVVGGAQPETLHLHLGA